MNEIGLKQRTKQFGLHLMRLVNTLPNMVPGRAIANQSNQKSHIANQK
jgi:hypothetical protein